MEPRLLQIHTIGLDEEWTVEMAWYEDDRHGPGRLEIRPTDPSRRPAGGLSQTVLRDVDFAAAVDQMRETEAVAAKLPRINWETIGDELADLSEGGITDGYLAMLSLVYCASNQPKPLEFLAELTGKSSAAIKSHLWQATRKGFLVRSPGRRGGRFTAKAVDLLTRNSEIRH